ncbi:putative Kinesin motor family protein [Tripterygium wilfordii]|uniref:Putative Kinesin motor family protein n=1 Tax=Tripterygium wilfordii TaxID=458696 RepID=A0A7J7C3E2_TRIWF|nr:putative Kinesin motor family protein [Tripterygium wilfordii]
MENGESRLLGSLSTSAIRNLLHRSLSVKPKPNSKNPRSPKSNAENTPPVDPNAQFHDPPLSPSVPKLSPSKSAEINGSNCQSEGFAAPDPAVKVFVRIRPLNDPKREPSWAAAQVSPDSLSFGERKFMFDSVFSSNSNQEDVFQLVGVPLVKNALAGYNTTILSYGQTGSGKTYTMWGPPSAMVEDPSGSSLQGIAPRISQMIFSEIQREQKNLEGKQINYQCRCSFLEVYNEQIGDLLDQTQRNLEIPDDPKNGLYVENLTEEYVTSYEDATQILIKGLSSRKVGATGTNSKSSRSNIIFTFIIESWCKEASSKCFSSSKTSRISLVDLVGLDEDKLDGASRQHVREGKYAKKSLSKLGHVVKTLANGTLGGYGDVPYRSSCLTHLLRESLGGNCKLAVICTISPDNINDNQTLKTLRFGERVKSIRNKPVINEISENDVNDLTDQIRQLKEELVREKSDVYSSVKSKSGYFRGHNGRDSLNQLRVSLNRSLILPDIDNHYEKEVVVDEEDVRELRQQLDKLHSPSDNRDSIQSSGQESCETGLTSEDDINFPEDTEIEEMKLEKSCDHVALAGDLPGALNTSRTADSALRHSRMINPSRQSPVLQEPTLSESPKIANSQRKSVAISSTIFASQNNVPENPKVDVSQQSIKQSQHIQSSLGSSKIFPGPTESLAASLRRGLHIIDHHQRNSASNRSSVSFSFEHLTLRPCPEVDKSSCSSVKTLAEETPSGPFLCVSCRQKLHNNSKEAQDSLKTWIITADDLKSHSKRTDQVSAVDGNELAKATQREKELEIICREQSAKIEQLNHLVEQYKHNNTLCLDEDVKNEIIPYEELKVKDCYSLMDGNKCLKENDSENYELDTVTEIREVQEVVHHRNGNTYFDMNEKEEFLKEIQNLRSTLQSYTDASLEKSTEKLRSSLLSRSFQLRKSVDTQQNSEDELEKERQRCTEMESDWISLTDELRIDIETHRQRAEKVEMELKLEKKCTEELDDVIHRAVLGHARIIEHYNELQEKYNDLLGKNRAIMEGIADVKKAAAKAGAKGHGAKFAKSMAAELSALRFEREKEREFLRKENKNLKVQLRDTAEAVHAAGELLVRLREAEQSASVAEDNFTNLQQENEKLRKQMEKLKRKHKMEVVTMKQYMAESRLPESALQPLYREDSDAAISNSILDDDQAWRAEFGAIYQEHY